MSNNKSRQKSGEIRTAIWRWVVQVWIIATIIAFVVIRVLGSNLGRTFLNWSKHLSPR